MSSLDLPRHILPSSTPETHPTAMNAGSSPSTPPYSPVTPEMSRAELGSQTHPQRSEPSAPPSSASRPIVLIPSQPTSSVQSHPPTPSAIPKIPSPQPQRAPPALSSMPPPPVPASQAPVQTQPSILQQEPPLEPLDLENNPDAIALRAAMSLLQLQRQQAIRDLQILQTQKRIALEDPNAFVAAVNQGNVRTRTRDGGSGGVDFTYTTAEEEDDDEDDDDEDTEMTGIEGDRAGTVEDRTELKMQLPTPQNVVRAPPVEWGKYHIVGAALDRLHDQQITNPNPSQPRTDEDVRVERMKVLAREGAVPGRKWERGEEGLKAPYDVFKDEIVGAGGRGVGPGGAGEGEEKKKTGALSGTTKAVGGTKAGDSKRRKSSGIGGGNKKKGKAKVGAP